LQSEQQMFDFINNIPMHYALSSERRETPLQWMAPIKDCFISVCNRFQQFRTESFLEESWGMQAFPLIRQNLAEKNFSYIHNLNEANGITFIHSYVISFIISS
jgi:hypothetical protein